MVLDQIYSTGLFKFVKNEWIIVLMRYLINLFEIVRLLKIKWHILEPKSTLLKLIGLNGSESSNEF